MNKLGRITVGEAEARVWSLHLDFPIYSVWGEVGRGVTVRVDYDDEQQARTYFAEHPIVIEGVPVPVPVSVEVGPPIVLA